jgi:rhodanese-related sulfurtransferase
MKTLLALLLLSGVASAQEVAELTVQQVHKRLGEKNFYVFDNNPRDLWQEAHVPKARWLDYNRVAARDLPIDKSATLVFYCANEQCHACHKGAGAALKLGYKNVFVMPAGIMGWQRAGLPTEPGSR